jgi:hypothetical protein
MRDILIRRCLSTDLSSNAVIAERVIRRGTSHSNECCHRAEFSEG